MKRIVKRVALGLVAAIAAVLVAFGILYASRIQTISSIDQVTSYDDGYNLYTMDVAYDYDLDALLARDIRDNQAFLDAVLAESLPLLPVHMTAPNYACTAFTATAADGEVRMGRNYDFKLDTSALLVRCTPKDGYASIGLAALNNVKADDPNASVSKKLACLTAPFICLDGINEKGVSIAVLTLDSEPTYQDTGKQSIATTLAIRLVLDRAATTEEAVELLSNYDMFATSGRDYHFYITDASGDGRVVEWDPEAEGRPLKATPMRAITNFYALYPDLVQPNQKNGIYGHGKERWEAVEEVLGAHEGDQGEDVVWEALRASAQDPNPEDVTSNTQWSAIYDNTGLTLEVCLRRNWNDVSEFSIH